LKRGKGRPFPYIDIKAKGDGKPPPFAIEVCGSY
jgi:hypothetical protein